MGDGIAAPVAAVVASAHGEQDELLGFLDGKEAQQDLVEEGENGGVCADAESQGQDGYGGEAGSAGEHAKGVLEVAKDGVEPADGGQAAGGIIAGLGHRNPPGQLEVKTKNVGKSLMKVRKDSWIFGGSL